MVGIIALLLFIIGVYSSLSWGFVLYKFWGWFLLPIFPTLPILDFWMAVGLMFVIGLFHAKSPVAENLDIVTNFIITFLGPWITLILAWIIGSLWIF